MALAIASNPPSDSALRGKGRTVLALVRTSSFRLAAFYFSLFATSVLALLGFIYWQTVVYIERQADETIDAEISSLSDQYRQGGLEGLIGIINERSDPERGSSMLYLLVDGAGLPLAGNLTRWPDAHVDPDGWMRFTLEAPSGRHAKGRHEAQITSFALDHGYQLLVGRDMAELYAFRHTIILALGWAAGITLCLGLAGGLVMSRGALRRIETINRACAALIAGETSRRIPIAGTGDEFDHLADNLNTMLDRIQELMEAMRQVTDNIAHDLRSPLSRLRSRIEVALLDSPSVERYRQELENTIVDADHLLLTFNALMEIAEAEAGSLPVNVGPVDAGELMEGLADLYEPVTEEKGLALRLQVPEDAVFVRGGKQLLSRALVNLIENAVKYTPAGGYVRLAVVPGPDKIQMIVADSGPGIPVEAREKVFDRFFRLESSRTTEGNGLGLSLVRAIVKLHEGSIILEDEIPSARPPGLRVTINLRGISHTNAV